jgi:hypothetical protein
MISGRRSTVRSLFTRPYYAEFSRTGSHGTPETTAELRIIERSAYHGLCGALHKPW